MSATAVADSMSGARARSRFHTAWSTAAASANASAMAGMRRRYAHARMTSTPQAVVFDFNGTLSDDEPVLARVYQELFAELGRPITEAEYYEHLAGHTDEEMLIRWFGSSNDAWIAERIDRYNALAADGSTIDERDARGASLRRRARAGGDRLRRGAPRDRRRRRRRRASATRWR